MSVQVNPYAPPSAPVADIITATSEEEAVRREHIKHEASVRSVGILYYIGGGLMVLGGIGLAALVFTGTGAMLEIVASVIYLVLGPVSLAVARGIRRFKPWARTTCIVLSAIGLLGFPLGTLINAYILYLMLSAKGRRIFQPDYPAIVAATPHIKYRTSIVVWIVLAVLLLAILGLIAVGLLAPAG